MKLKIIYSITIKLLYKHDLLKWSPRTVLKTAFYEHILYSLEQDNPGDKIENMKYKLNTTLRGETRLTISHSFYLLSKFKKLYKLIDSEINFRAYFGGDFVYFSSKF